MAREGIPVTGYVGRPRHEHRPLPRHAKRYADFVAIEAELHEKRVAAFRAFAADVATGAYPEPRHEVPMDADAYEELLRRSGTR